MRLGRCRTRWCLRPADWEVVGITDQGNRLDGNYCGKHSKIRIETNVMLGRKGMWGRYLRIPENEEILDRGTRLDRIHIGLTVMLILVGVYVVLYT